MTDDTIDQGYARMDRQMKEENQRVQERENCLYCGEAVADESYDWKYMQAGGVLEGPFCGRECQFGWLMDD